MGKFLKFEKMITPIFIQIIFWISFVGVIISGVAMVGYGVISSSGSFIEIIIGISTLFLCPIIIRIYCEMLIVIFKIQESLIDIRELLSKQHQDGSHNAVNALQWYGHIVE